MRIAAIDIGTNSLHMIVVRVRTDLSFEVIDRETENGAEFLKAITEKTGIRPRVISGTEEARFIHLAAVYGVGVPGDMAVVVDIGGGSVEITRGAGSNAELGRSFKLGVIRLTERFVKSDPLSPH